jgi:hypothetical protein
MGWIKKKLRNWLRDDDISIPEDRPHHTMGEAQTSVQMFRAMNGVVLVLHTQNTLGKNLVTSRQAGPTIYVLKEGESVQDAVATLLVKARLDNL